MALEFLLGFADGYLTVADNYFVYQTSPNSTQFIFLLWDIDLSLGSTSLIDISQIEAGDWHKFTSAVTKRPLMKFLQVPEYANRFDQLIQELNDKLVNIDVLGQRIDETAAMLKEDVEWDKSCPRVSSAGLLNYNDMAVLAHAFGFMKTVDVNMHTVHDFNQRQRHEDVDFMKAVNGPTGYKHSLVGLKEYIKIKHQNVADHYGSKQ